MNIFCKHKWEILSDTTTESKFEHALSASSATGAIDIKLPPQVCNADRINIQIVSCLKCGKLKRFVTDL